MSCIINHHHPTNENKIVFVYGSCFDNIVNRYELIALCINSNELHNTFGIFALVYNHCLHRIVVTIL